ncbi:putative bifunctional diguanylate cyclase/phosphodiesterase [Cellulomonas sp. NS3]|uniref:putative bifunctional diguanylate cyclase/phosphodiesterase n=1 Tax=Cellulomonas sp. NS3 TaxID=2973977 RepID=UPI00216290A4|nr:GGDEF domain-containing phosphodiesterase [Cellulomonas sp. NS3]
MEGTSAPSSGRARRADGEVRTGSPAAGAWPVGTYVAVALALLLLATALGLGFAYQTNAQRAREHATDDLRADAEIAAWTVTQSVVSARAQVESLVAAPGLATLLDDPAGCVLPSAGASILAEVRVSLVTGAGDVACTSRPEQVPAEPGLHAGSDWLTRTLGTSTTQVVGGAQDPATGRPSIVVARAFAADDAGGRAAAVLFLDVGTVAADLGSILGLGTDAVVGIVDVGTGRVVSASGPDSGALLGAVVDPTRLSGETEAPDGVARLFASADVEPAGWRVYRGVEAASVVADARQTLSTFVVLGSLALLAIVALGWLAQRRVARPLRALTAAVTGARTAGTGAQVEVAGPAELRLLAQEFNALLDIRAGHEARLAHQATHDRLTGLPNKDLLRERLARALDPGSGSRVSVLCVGINRFQTISDSLGHDGADRVLVEASVRLSSALRPGDLLVREGGHDFMVLGRDLTVDGAVVLAQRLLAALAEPVGVGSAGIVLTAAIGIAPQDRDPAPERLLREADTAMGRARELGIDWAVFDASMQRRATRYLETEQALRRALTDDELVVYYQPLVEVASGRITGAEALVRWAHPTRGLVAPLEFVPVAEETGLISALGEVVLRGACEQAARWCADGHPLRISVNVSGAQLQDGAFVPLVADVLRATGLPADRLCLEVTESTLVRWATHGRESLDRLRATGVLLSVDDFGTGYSSLSYLQDLPMTELKIDRSFVARLARDTRDLHLVEAVLGMARALGLGVVAEGVESSDQHAILRRLGCDRAQGFHFAPPQTAAAFGRLLRDRDSRPDLERTHA